MFFFYNTKHIIVQLGLNDISILSEAYEGSVDIAISATIAFIQNIQSLEKKVIWITNYPLDKDGLKDGTPYEKPGHFFEGGGEFGQGKIDCTPDMTFSDCKRYWNSNYEYFIDRLKPWCKNNNVGFINVFQYIRDAYGGVNTDDFIEAYSKDGVHIEYPGSEFIYNYILLELETILSYDLDNDAIIDCNDNCPSIYNPDQADSDEDGAGDVCDECTDTDKDEYGNPGFIINTCSDDNCPNDYNPFQIDCDSDGVGDICDGDTIDSDGDGVDDECDNCPNTPNTLQEDTFPPLGNGIGDACDCESDFGCDQDVDGSDASTIKKHFGRNNFQYPCTALDTCRGDFSCDGDVDGSDAFIFKSDFGRSSFSNPCPVCTAGVEWCRY